MPILRGLRRTFILIIMILPVLLSLRANCQETSNPVEALRPVLSHIAETLSGLSISHWKAPGEVRSASQRDIDSIQRDLSSTLPPLMDQASAAPSSIPAAFAVYRNIDALYDVLLRVSETANLAASQTDASSLENSLSGLEAARRDFGNSILQLATSHEEELARLRAAAAAQAAAAAALPPPPAPKKTVIDDGPAPANKTTTHKKKKPTTTPAPASTPSPQ